MQPGDKKIKKGDKLQRMFMWLLALCRVFAGLLVLKTGVDLLRGASYLGYDNDNAFITGFFAVLIGVYIIFSSLARVLFPEDKKHKQE